MSGPSRAPRPPEERYTDPELRARLKDAIQAGDRGGRPGQWTARKAQLLVHEYEAAGGGYLGERDVTAEHLSEWTAQQGETSEAADERARRHAHTHDHTTG